MKRLTSALTYSNVVATAALFLALSGGVVYAATSLGKNVVKAHNIAADAVKARNLSKNSVKARSIAPKAVTNKSLAPNAVTGAKIQAETITGANIQKAGVTRGDLATGTLSGLPLIEAAAPTVPGLNVENELTGTAVPLTGTLGFIPTAGKTYELLTELKGTPTPAGGLEAESCFAEVEVFVNGVPYQDLVISSNPNGAPPFNNRPFDGDATAIGLQDVGVPVNLSAISYGSTGCSATTTASLRAVVVEFG